MYIYMCMCIYISRVLCAPRPVHAPSRVRVREGRAHARVVASGWLLGLYKIVFYFVAFMWDSILLSLLPPTCIARTIAILLHVYCARCDPPPTPPLYAIHHTIFVMEILCKGHMVAYLRRRLGQEEVAQDWGHIDIDDLDI